MKTILTLTLIQLKVMSNNFIKTNTQIQNNQLYCSSCFIKIIEILKNNNSIVSLYLYIILKMYSEESKVLYKLNPLYYYYYNDKPRL